jgi:hypothetical protein
MNITKQQLRQLIKEELRKVLQEQLPVRPAAAQPTPPASIDQRVKNLEEKYNEIAMMLGLGPIGVSTPAESAHPAKPAEKIKWPPDYDPKVDLV